MTDKYTEMAEEWEKAQTRYSLHGRGPKPEDLPTLLRRVAREQIEEDAERAKSAIHPNRNAYEQGAAIVIANSIRSRAKELED